MPLLSQAAAGHRPDDTPRESQPSEAAGGSRVTPADDLRNATGFSLAAYRWAYNKLAVHLYSIRKLTWSESATLFVVISTASPGM